MGLVPSPTPLGILSPFLGLLPATTFLSPASLKVPAAFHVEQGSKVGALYFIPV